MPIGPVGAALISAGSSIVSNIWNAREAERNRRFQERMSSTAHQREVRDLQAAGINPMLSRMGSGATTPGGDRAQMEDPAPRAISSALAVQQARANIELTRRQAELAATQAGDIRTTWSSGRGELLQQQVAAGALNLAQMREALPIALERAREEVKLTSSSAQAARARAVLDEAAAAGAENLEAFEKRIGEKGPWVRTLFQLLKAIRR